MATTPAESPIRSLIVEDDAACRVLLRRTLEKLGVGVVGECLTGKRAISDFRAISAFRDAAPDIVFVDVGLPDINGIEVLKAILAADPVAKVVMVTASHDREVVREALAAGAVGYVVKPFAIGTMRSTFARLFPGREMLE